MTPLSLSFLLGSLLLSGSFQSQATIQPAWVVKAQVSTTASPSGITLTYSESDSKIASFTIYRGEKPDFLVSSQSQIGKSSGNGSSIYFDPAAGLTPGKTYYYKVTAVTADGTTVLLGPTGLGESSAPSALPVAATLPFSTLDVIFIGDSITEGGWIRKPAMNACEACSSYLERLGGPRTVFFSNEGHSGHTTKDYLPGGQDFSHAEESARQTLKEHPGDLLFTIMLGTNDSATTGTNGAGATPSIYEENTKAIVDKLLAEFPMCKIVLEKPTWYSPNTHNFSSYEEVGLGRLVSYMPALDDLAAHYRKTKRVSVSSADAFNFFATHYAEDLNPENGKNGTFYLHPNAKGCEDLGLFWAESILAVIKSKN